MFALLAGLAVNGSSCNRTSDSSGRLVINEAMARNRNFPLVDSHGLHLDWVEVHNPTNETVSLAGYTLSDDRRRPDKYRFPAGYELPPGGFVVVFLASNGDIEEYESQVIDGQNPVFRPGPFHGTFGLSASAETVWLFADDGRLVADRIEIHQLATDISVGRFPDASSRFGKIYAPTPGEPNREIGIAPVRWLRQPRTGAPREDGRIPISFEVEQDAANGVGMPEVIVEFAELAGGCDLSEEVIFLPLDFTMGAVSERDVTGPCESATPGADVDPDDGCRRDAKGAVVPLSVRTIEFTAFLPARPEEECGTSILYRVVLEDGIRTLATAPICYTYCAVEPTLVVNEYQARNQSTAFFVCETCENDCNPEQGEVCISIPGWGVRQLRTPDWFEIYNYGEEELDISRFGVSGQVVPPALPQPKWFFGADTTIDGVVDERMHRIGPGEYRLILADNEQNDVLRRLVRDGSGQLVPD
ncbi:MAG TPA: lamin tail domain-containing protein, partial [Planctomycetota bacterium]|nr:lamin tail domain-containing protein [Planctomycetota bacterium]